MRGGAVAAVALIALWIAVLVAGVLVVNHGTFTYALDDAYIHLDLSDMIGRSGFYGVNAGEPAAPSSSILWPFLLAPFAGTPLHPWAPLALGACFAVAATAVLYQIVVRLLGPGEVRAWHVILTCLSALALNLPGLTLMGMEHTLQVFLTLGVVLGLLKVLEGEAPPGWLWGAVCLGPLVRYENALVSAGALGVLLWKGHGRAVLLCGLAVTLSLATFSGFLAHLGLYPLPASTVVKRFRMDDYWSFFGKALLPAFVNPLALVLFLLACLLPFLALVSVRRWRAPAWVVLGAVAGASVLHIFIGRYSGFGGAPRYEFYLAAFTLPLLFWLLRDQRERRARMYRAFLCLVCFGALTGLRSSLGDVVRDAHSIYLQQYQMGRLVQDVWKEPVAANDVGLIGDRNPHYVLDLIGLSNNTVLKARATSALGWAPALIERHNVSLILLYRTWFPSWSHMGWVPVGELFCHACSSVTVQPYVLVLVPRPEEAPRARALLRTWGESLPEGATLHIYDDAHPAPSDSALERWAAHLPLP